MHIGAIMKSVMLFIFITITSGTAAEVPKKAEYTPEAEEILLKAYRYLDSLDSYSFDAVTNNESPFLDIMMVELTHRIHTEVVRPDKLRIDISGDGENKSFYLYNGVFTIYNRNSNLYGQVAIPGLNQDIDDTLDFLYEKYHIKTALANLLYSDLEKRLMPEEDGYYFGVTFVGKTECDYIGFDNDNRELLIWVERGKYPLIKKFIVTDKTDTDYPRSTTTIDWHVNMKIPEEHFIFKAPEGAYKIPVKPAMEEK